VYGFDGRIQSLLGGIEAANRSKRRDAGHDLMISLAIDDVALRSSRAAS
jgi:hypothetical protein